MGNYKKEEYPADIKQFIKNIDSNCSDFDNKAGMPISDIFESRNNKIYATTTIKELANNKNEIKGLYAFKDKNKFVYFGISQSIIRRLRQHFYGKEHNQATLVYVQAKEEFKRQHKEEYQGLRKNFNFEEYGYPIQKNNRKNYKIVIQPISDNFELYYSEIYYSCFYEPFWNTFETH